jgi:hypothetical protein
MISTRLNKWMVALWGMSGLLGAVDLFGALRSPNGDLTHPNSQILMAGSYVLLAVGLVILYSPRRGPVPVAVAVGVALAVGALTLRIWVAMLK